jgi:hypothetical protein
MGRGFDSPRLHFSFGTLAPVRRSYTLRTLEGYLARRDVPCPSCGYNLRGLSEGTCPECGFGFDVESLKALRTPRPLLIEWALDHVFSAILLLVCLNHGVSTMTLDRPERRLVGLLSLGIMLLLVPSRLYADLLPVGRGHDWAGRIETVCAFGALAQSLVVLRLIIF